MVILDGNPGVRVSQIWGARRGTLYPGTHFVAPLVDRVAWYDTHEQVYRTAASASAKSENEVLIVQAREGLNIGSAGSVRYRLDPRQLDTIPAKAATEITTVLPMIQRIPMVRRQFRQSARHSGWRRGSR